MLGCDWAEMSFPDFLRYCGPLQCRSFEKVFKLLRSKSTSAHYHHSIQLCLFDAESSFARLRPLLSPLQHP